MINLIPQEYGSTLRNARFNAQLRQWLIGSIAAIVGLIIIMSTGWLYINQQIEDLNSGVAAQKKQLQDQKLTDVQKNADTLSSNIKVINQVLNREIRFSDLIQAIGAVMPNGTVLGSLTLGQVSGALDLSASAKDYTSAAQIAVNLSDPKNNLFNKVDIINISCTNANTSAYPCSGTFKTLFNKNTQSRFLNVPKGGD